MKNKSSKLKIMQNTLIRKSMELNILFDSQVLLILKNKDEPIIYCSENNIENFVKNTCLNKSIWKKILTNEDIQQLLKLKKPKEKPSHYFKKKMKIPDIFDKDNSKSLNDDKKVLHTQHQSFSFCFDKKSQNTTKKNSEFDQILSIDKNLSDKIINTNKDKALIENGNEKGLSKIKQKLSLKVVIPDENIKDNNLISQTPVKNKDSIYNSSNLIGKKEISNLNDNKIDGVNSENITINPLEKIPSVNNFNGVTSKNLSNVNLNQNEACLNPIAIDQCTSDFIQKLYNQSLLYKNSSNNFESARNPELEKKPDSRTPFDFGDPVFLKPLEYPVTSKEFLGNKRFVEENIQSGGNMSVGSFGANQLYKNNPFSLISPSCKTNKFINYNVIEPKNLFNNSYQKMNQFSNPNEINYISQNLTNNFLNNPCMYSNSSYMNMNAFHQFENLSYNSFDPKQYFFFQNNNFPLYNNCFQNKEDKFLNNNIYK